jgi:ribosomal protein S18 acetylase RimI-like enzyme
MARRRVREKVVVEVLDAGDLVAIAQVHALDATVFPHASVPALVGAPSVLVARDAVNGRVVGFVALRREGEITEVMGLAVDPERRRGGVGRALLKATLAHARRAMTSAVALHVSTANAAALALYDREGFEAAKRIARFYSPERFGDGGDAFLMIRRVRPSR